ncbi:MAG: polysaccharide biosynthesis/export family protein [Bacteroidales bacterium]|nr:polysaccharide biosynthesis/export family protein [Bacteroidales bacterium]MDD4235145.1 polysaccharide biosynthesis/export family protein [Bacteroidales bacterium]MDY0161510.1 polysaccharide biosynthesis/export family protein [Bacteroidales bacterium]
MKLFKSFMIFLVLVLLIGLNSCKILRPSEMFIVDEEHPIAEFKPSEKEYKIKPFDKLSVRITTNDGFSLIGVGQGNTESSYRRQQQGFEYLVEFDGLIKLPTLGRIPITGYTMREAEEYLEELYSQYYQSPFVLLSVTNRKAYIFFNGATKANIVTIPTENLTLIEAIASTGGVTEISRSYRIKLIRGELTENPEVYYWNLRRLDDLKDSNILLEANDVIYVDSKPQYISRALREVAPYLTLLTTALSVYGIFFR